MSLNLNTFCSGFSKCALANDSRDMTIVIDDKLLSLNDTVCILKNKLVGV